MGSTLLAPVRRLWAIDSIHRLWWCVLGKDAAEFSLLQVFWFGGMD